jgi:hypothetical protein
MLFLPQFVSIRASKQTKNKQTKNKTNDQKQKKQTKTNKKASKQTNKQTNKTNKQTILSFVRTHSVEGGRCIQICIY